MEVHEAIFTFVMIGSAAAACFAFAMILGEQDWQLFAAICLIYFVFTFMGYIRAYSRDHYA